LTANSFGRIFKVHTFGESHGPALGAVIDGCPAGLQVDLSLLEKELRRRRPGHSAVVSARKEADQFEILSGIFEGKTLGTPIAVIVRNTDARSEDYSLIQQQPRQGHADDVWKAKFGHSDHRGGGRSSGRETLARVIGGAFAKMYLRSQIPQYSTVAFAKQIGKHQVQNVSEAISEDTVEQFPARFPDTMVDIENYLMALKDRGDSVGGIGQIQISGLPVGLGEPLFDKLDADIAYAMMGINAVKGVEIGAGFRSIAHKGSEHGDEITPEGFVGNNAGGVLGGISSGQDITVSIAIKPTSSIRTPRRSIDRDGQPVMVETFGRHDPCVGIRATPIAEAMLALVLMDHALRQRAQCGDVDVSGS
jgi:chorismate synthase